LNLKKYYMLIQHIDGSIGKKIVRYDGVTLSVTTAWGRTICLGSEVKIGGKTAIVVDIADAYTGERQTDIIGITWDNGTYQKDPVYISVDQIDQIPRFPLFSDN